MANRISQIKNTIKDFKDIFEEDVLQNLDNLIKTDSPEIYLPDINLDSLEQGLALKENVGFISIQETYKEEVVAYVYRFFTLEYQCLFCKNNTSDHVDNFSFHYDKTENNIPHPPHLSTMFRSLRYYSRDIELREFLEFIEDTFFIRDQGNLVRKNGHLWDSRFI